MGALIVTAASTGLALALLLVPPVFVATVMLATIFLFIGASAAVLAYLVGVPATEQHARQPSGTVHAVLPVRDGR